MQNARKTQCRSKTLALVVGLQLQVQTIQTKRTENIGKKTLGGYFLPHPVQFTDYLAQIDY